MFAFKTKGHKLFGCMLYLFCYKAVIFGHHFESLTQHGVERLLLADLDLHKWGNLSDLRQNHSSDGVLADCCLPVEIFIGCEEGGELLQGTDWLIEDDREADSGKVLADEVLDDFPNWNTCVLCKMWKLSPRIGKHEDFAAQELVAVLSACNHGPLVLHLDQTEEGFLILLCGQLISAKILSFICD
jgi:hypothetical protein